MSSNNQPDDTRPSVEIEKGPNGFPFADDIKLSQWETGEYHLKVFREDGEGVCTTLRPEQFDALVEMVREVDNAE